MRRSVLLFVFVLAGSLVGHAQIVVYDGAVTLRNSVTAALKEYLLTVQGEQHSQLRRMAQRLSLHTSLNKYAFADVPRWRTHDFESFLYANTYHAALNYGDSNGAAFQSVTHPVIAAGAFLERLSPAARRAFAARLATVDLADATVMAATHDTGQLRYNGRRELRAIDALEGHVIDPSNEQSATAVLDKMSGAVLIGARQRQARTQLLSGFVEQLLIESKRGRDTETATMNMQLVTWRDREAANTAFVAGSGDALRVWRQP